MYVFCQIKDSGHGIKPENLSQVFEPFYTTRFVGRGLGLALTVGIMRLHHGAIIIESTPDRGTIVRVLFRPIESSQQSTLPHEGSKSEPVQLTGNILLADDAPIVLDVGKRMLEILGFTVHTAVNGQEAVNKVRSQEIDFCAVVLDVSMPVIDGIQVMQEIRKIDPSIPVLLSSGTYEEHFSFNDERNNKPDGFLQKPFQLSDIRKYLKKVLL